MVSRRGSWFFEGYQRKTETDANGKTHRRLVYKGEYYGFPGGKEERKRVKGQTLALSVICVAAYLYAQFNPYIIGMIHWMAIPSLLTLVPLLFLVTAYFNFLPAGELWEVRVYYSGYRRLFRFTVLAALLLVIWAGMDIVFLLMNLALLRYEVVYLLCALVSAAAMTLQAVLIRHHPAVVMKGPTVE